MTYIRQVLSFFLISILVGCSSVPEPITSVEWQSHQNKLSRITHFQVAGKLAYISPQQRQSLNFQWKHSATSSNLRLTTFLGQTALNLTITPQGARVETYDDDVFTGPSATLLVKSLTGLLLPIDHMPQWLLGLPTDADHFQINENNTLRSLTKQVGQQNWQLDYLTYREINNTSSSAAPKRLPLPSKLKFTQADITINIVASKWKITE